MATRGAWPWLLAAGPALVVVASLATAWIALTRGDPVVAVDYYKIGLSINRRLAAAPAPLPTPGAVIVLGERGDVQVTLSDSTPLPSRLRLGVHKPGALQAGGTLSLVRDADRRFVGTLADSSHGRRIVTLESEAWRLPVTVVDDLPATVRIGTVPPAP